MTIPQTCELPGHWKTGGSKTFVDNLDDAFLAREFRYLNNAGKLCLDPASLILAHFFNQTHHRGQVHVMSSQTPVKSPNLDMHRAIRPVNLRARQKKPEPGVYDVAAGWPMSKDAKLNQRKAKSCE